MKKICLLLFAWLIASIAALANVVIFDPAVDMAAVVTEPPFILEKDGITVTISAGMVNNGSQYRVYKGATITICSSMCDITNIEFQCTAQDDEKYGPGNFVVNTGSYSWEGYVGEWQGKAMCVTFTAEKNQVRITKIIVTYDCDGIVSKPVISPASGTYYQPIEVSITCPNNDATIHYTTNGTDPTAASPQYSFPFTVNNDVTIKAISVLDDEMSDVATASYEFVEASQINNLADALQAPDGTTIFFPNPLIALAQHGPRLFVKDETAYALIYGNSNQTYTNGDIIPGGFYFTKSFYAGEPEFMDPQGFKPATEHVVVDPEEIEDLLGHDLFGHYVVLHNVTIIKEDNQYFAVDANGNRYPIYFGSMGVSAPTDLSETYDLYAIVGSYGNENTIYQLLPVKLVRSLPITLCDMFNYPDNEPITFDHEAYVIYQYNRYLYLMDECGYGVVYGDVGQTYNMGDVIPTGWGGTKTTWNGEPEIKDPTGFQPASRHENLTPMLITIPQAGHLLWAHYVELRNVYIDQENMLIRDQEGNTIPYYPQLPYQVDPTRTYDILAIITSYKRTETIYRLFIISTSYIIPPPPEPCCLTDLYEDYNKGQTVKFACPLTVIYHNSPYLYVKDSCGNYGLIYGNGVGGPF